MNDEEEADHHGFYDGVDYTHLNSSATEDLITKHTVNIIIGALCALINVPLLLVFLTHPPFRLKYKILIALALADFTNCLGIMLMGINRVRLYSSVLSSSLVPVRTVAQCASEPWVWVRCIGDLWPPSIQVMMGAERVFAVFMPILFRANMRNRSYWSIGASGVFVLLSLGTALVAVYARRDEAVKFHCGRKAAFSNDYGLFVYVTNIAGFFACLSFSSYMIGALLNLAAFLRARQHQMSLDTARGSARGTERFRFYLAVSFCSTALVALPNLLSLMSVLYKKVSDEIARPAVWATCVNSGANFFVYLALNSEFRQRVLDVMRWPVTSGRRSKGAGEREELARFILPVAATSTPEK